MKNITIQNYTLSTKLKTYLPISFDVKEKQIWGIYSNNSEVLRTFFDALSGINNNHQTIFYKDKSVFDQSAFFKKRIYFDFSSRYLTTINADRIEETVWEYYQKRIDKEQMKKHAKALYVRGEYITEYKGTFTNLGNTCANFCLFASMDVPIALILNPTIYVRNSEDIQYMVNVLTDKNSHDNVFLGLDHVGAFINQLDYLLVFGDGEEPKVLNPQKDKLYVFENNVSPEITKYRLFDSKDTKRMIVHRNYTDDELKMFKRRKIDHVEISVTEFENYL